MHVATTTRKSKDASAAGSSATASGSAGGVATGGGAHGYTVLARRYRSRSFSELVGQEAIARTLQNAIATGRTAHAYLFCGTRGVGKTSMARIFARALNSQGAEGGLLVQAAEIGDAILRGEDMDVIEIDGASNRGIDDARELIAGAGIAPARSRYKIYIIDEVHMLTTQAFNALLKTMEEPPAHVKFILCTTEAHKVPATIQSRCQRFDFRNIPTAQIAEHLRHVLKAESITAEEAAVMQVARLANGSMRDGLSLLDRLVAASASGALTAQLLSEVLGLPDAALVAAVAQAIGRGSAPDALRAGAALLESGSSVEQALELLADRFRTLMLASACGADSPLVELADEARAEAGRDAAPFDAATLAHMIAVCDAVLRSAKQSGAPRTLFDAALVRLALAQRFAPAEGSTLPPESPPKKSQRP